MHNPDKDGEPLLGAASNEGVELRLGRWTFEMMSRCGERSKGSTTSRSSSTTLASGSVSREMTVQS